MKVHIFNPENDLALASGKPGYVAPASARQMRSDLSWLPEWWADEGDVVWDGVSPLQLNPGDEIVPWGWSPALVHQLQKAGVNHEFLPTPEQVDHLRNLSHRRTAVEALQQMKADGVAGSFCCGHSVECQSMQDVENALKEHHECMLKAPWSSSGKGLMLSTAPNLEGWVNRILRQQGSVVVEQLLHKLADFALLFQCDGKGGVEYRGISLFYTNDNGAYAGNWLAHEGEKLQWLMQYVPPQPLMEIRSWWENYLTHFDYRGPLGVDMMLCEEGICPCVEINWRMTMGHVAQLLTEQGRTGKFKVEYVYGRYGADVEGFF